MKINCFTCKYGYKDERLGIPLCHHPKRFSEDCVNFNMHEEKETEESEKPINLDDAMKELDEKIALVKQRGTWKGVDVDKYMDDVRGREPEKPMNLEEEVKRYYSDNFAYISSDQPTLSILTNIARHFAEWQKEQLMKEAVEGEYDFYPAAVYLDVPIPKMNHGDKVRIIIVKED